MIISGVLIGPLYDRGYLRTIIAFGSVFNVFGMVVIGFCSRYWQVILAQGVLVGLGSGCLFLPSIAILPQYFEKKRGLATGIGSSGSAFGKVKVKSHSIHLLILSRRNMFSHPFQLS